MTGSTLTFLDRHEPSLEPGDYTIMVEQGIAIGDRGITETFRAEQRFSVLGPRFTLDPQEILEMFPPPGGLGNHAHVFPHIILRRSTLPWERDTGKHDRRLPWLALLLFDEGELPPERQRTEPLGKLREDSFFKGLLQQPEKGDHDDDQVTVIDVPGDLLKRLLPAEADLPYLAHVRVTEQNGAAPGDDVTRPREVAVVIGNRLPRDGATSVVHLVSLENRYPLDEAAYHGSTLVRLVSLKSWRFSCISPKQTFGALLDHLNQQLLFTSSTDSTTDSLVAELQGRTIPEALRDAFAQSGFPLSKATTTVSEYTQWRINDGGTTAYLVSNRRDVYNEAGRRVSRTTLRDGDPLESFKAVRSEINPRSAGDATITQDLNHWWIDDGTSRFFISLVRSASGNDVLYAYLVDAVRSSTLRLPPPPFDEDPRGAIETYFRRGCVPLPHVTQTGEQVVSWYHGPWTPGENVTTGHVELPVRAAEELLLTGRRDGMRDVSYAAAWELGRLLTLQNTRVAADLFSWKRAHAHDEQLQVAEERLAHLPLSPAKSDLSMPDSVIKWFDALATLHGVPFSYLVPDDRMLPTESIRFFCVDRRWIECLLDGAFSVGRVTSLDRLRDQRLSSGHAQTLLENRHAVVSGCVLRSDVVSGWSGLRVRGYDGDSLLTFPRNVERLSKNVLVCLFAGKVTRLDIEQEPESLHFGIDASGTSLAAGPKFWRHIEKRIVDVHMLAAHRTAESEPSSAHFARSMILPSEGVRLLVGASRLE